MNLYSIGIELSLQNGVSGVVGVIARDLAGLHGKVGELEKGFGRLKVAMAGAGAVFVGGAMLAGLDKLVRKGAELTHQTQLMAAAGFTAREQAEAMARAWQLSGKYPSVGVTTVAEIIRETAAPYGSAREAVKLAEMATRATVALNAVMPGHQGGKAAVNQMFAAVKSGELRNISLDPSAMQRWFDDMVKVAEVTGGKVLPADFFQFVKYSRTNAPYLSERFLSGVAPALIQELGPSGAGTAITTLGQAIIGGKMTKRALAEFQKLGLVAPGNVIKTTGVGVQLKSGGVKGYQLAETDPYLWAQRVLMPAMIAHGFVTREQQRLEFAALFSARNGETAANIMATQGQRIEKDRAMIAKGAVGDLFKGDLLTQAKAFHEQWENLLIAAGSPLVGPATDMIRGLTGALTKMGQWAAANPGAVRIIGESVAALGAALVMGGTIAVGAAAIAALPMIGVAGAWVAGAAALAAGAGALLAMNWGRVNAFGWEVQTVVSMDWNRAVSWAHRFHRWVEDVTNPKEPRPQPKGERPRTAAENQRLQIERGVFYELVGKWIDRAKALGHAFMAIDRYADAFTSGMTSHISAWLSFGGRLGTALGAILGRVTAFINDLENLPGRLVVDAFAKMFPAHAGGPAKPPAIVKPPPLAAAPKPPAKPFFHQVTPVDVRRAAAADTRFDPSGLLLGGLHFVEHLAGTDKAGKAIGAAAAHGLAAGVASTHPAVRGAARAMADQATAAAKDRLQIHSPSRVFAGIGGDMVGGLIMGLDSRASDLQRVVSDLVSGAVGAARLTPSRAIASGIRFGDMPVAMRADMAQPTRPAAVPEQGLHVHTTVHTHVNLDGRKVAENVTHHQAHSLRGPARSASFFDPTMAPAHPGDHYGN